MGRASINSGRRRRTFLSFEPLETRRVLATFVVTDLSDAGPGTLREAISQANALTGPDTIQFSQDLPANPTIALQSELEITESLTIDAFDVPDKVRITAQPLDPSAGTRLFMIPKSVNEPHGTVHLRNLELDGGRVTSSGGAIYSEQSLFLDSVHLHNNFASEKGGAVYFTNDSASLGLFVMNSIVEFNTAHDNGGGIAAESSFGTYVSIDDSTIRFNDAAFSGGGISVAGTNTLFSLFDSEVTGNIGHDGGAVHANLSGFAGRLIVQRSDIHQNFGVSGGGIAATAVDDADIDLFDVRIANNVGSLDSGGAKLTVSNGDLRISTSEIIGNDSGRYGGGLTAIAPGDGLISLGVVTIANNSAATDGGGLHLIASAESFANIYQSEIHTNSANRGGGVSSHSGFGADVRVSNSAIYRNTASDTGGGLWLNNPSSDSTIGISHSTISGNLAANDGGGVYFDSFDNSNELELHHATIAANVADGFARTNGQGGGLATSGAGVTALNHTVIADNRLGSSASDFSGSASGSFSLIESVEAGSSVVGSDLVLGVDPMLAPLARNEADTMTHAFAIDSPLMNGGESGNTGGQAYDQRGTGFPRVQFGTIDIGAFERNVEFPSGDVDRNGQRDCQDVDAITVMAVEGGYDVWFDMNADGSMDHDDVVRWLAVVGAANHPLGAPYKLGDANLDGQVNELDFDIWSANRFTANPSFCSGDFDTDGIVGLSDLHIWNGNRDSTVSPVIPFGGKSLDDSGPALGSLGGENEDGTSTTQLSRPESIPPARHSAGDFGKQSLMEIERDERTEDDDDSDLINRIFASS